MSSTLPPPQSFWAYRVKCIDASQSQLQLRVGKVYTVAAYMADGLLELKNCRGAFGRWRFEPVAPKPKKPVQPIGPDLPSTPFKPGDRVRCMRGYARRGLAEGAIYTVARVFAGVRTPAMLVLEELADRRPIFAGRFEPVDETPHIGSLDEYGPAPPAPVNPIFNAIGRRWPTHPSDVLQQLDELRGK